MGSNKVSQYIVSIAEDGTSRSAEMDEDLLDVARLMKEALPRLAPSPAFQARLKERLMNEPRPVPADSPVPVLASHSRELVLGAAVLSIAGAAVFLWRNRIPLGSEASSARIA